ncbi:hypothetical protein [uncultured Campylobacter sp.]|nr:hypothetical protein [uncultured Campylobacter sp.]
MICLNFTGERDFSGVKHRLDLRGFKFKSDKNFIKRRSRVKFNAIAKF